jgi:outer membrane protein OmpA-like peptidoglycan-associated protein
MSRSLEFETELESEAEMMGEYEFEEEFEGEGEFEMESEWEGEGELESEWEAESFGRGMMPVPPPGLRPIPGRPRRPVTTLPGITIRVRPFVVLRGFPTDQTTISPGNQRLIELAARRIVLSWRTPGRRRVVTVRLVGHTDARGSAAYNRALGLRRARAVRLRLMRAVERLQPGLSRRIRFIPQTLGESRPEVPNTTPAGRARNRRVQIYLSDV